mmetsp:Transcript_18881/g.52732  ORF Transcript_18881/g.52732 Transcript_18881/m.52732 type:complete len:115 (+) Transcript_18881:384-728(+)
MPTKSSSAFNLSKLIVLGKRPFSRSVVSLASTNRKLSLLGNDNRNKRHSLSDRVTPIAEKLPLIFTTGYKERESSFQKFAPTTLRYPLLRNLLHPRLHHYLGPPLYPSSSSSFP